MDIDVIIVGAGAAGLMAARELGKAGKKVLVLEARDRLGGRILALPEEEFGYPAQGGAEFVHGEAPVTRKLAEEAGLTLEHPSPWWNVNDQNEKIVIDPAAIHGDLLEQKLLALQADETVFNFMEREFADEEYAALRERTYRRVEGYDAADPRRMSVLAMREEMVSETGWVQRYLVQGYGALIAFLERESKAAGAEIHLNARVVRIEHSGSEVVAHTADGKQYRAAKVLLTPPAPVIPEIDFLPAILEQLEALSKIGFGTVIKILIRFKDKWWFGARERQFQRSFFLFSEEKIPTWWTQYPHELTTLTGWVAGPKASQLADLSDEELSELGLVSLSNIFKMPLEELRAEVVSVKVFNWQRDPFTRGAYSYPTPESEAALDTLARAINGKLYFAGELFGGSSSATVEGALASGQDAAKKILGIEN